LNRFFAKLTLSGKRRRRGLSEDESEKLMSKKKDNGPRISTPVESRLNQIELGIKSFQSLHVRIENLEKDVSHVPACDHTPCRYGSEEADRLNDLGTKIDNCVYDLRYESSTVFSRLEDDIIQAINDMKGEVASIEYDHRTDVWENIKDAVKKCMFGFESKFKMLVENAVEDRVNLKIKEIPQLEEKVLENVGAILKDKMKYILQGASLALDIK
jgi:hypothetical protein